MFAKCTSLQKVILKFMAMSIADYSADDCFRSMFIGCKNLNYINVNFYKWHETDDDDDQFDNWLAGVSPTGIFVKPKSLDNELGVSRIPSGWTIIDYYRRYRFVNICCRRKQCSD
jgi:hypothetical protein